MPPRIQPDAGFALDTRLLSPTYRSFFAEPERLAELQAALAPCLDSGLGVGVVYDPKKYLGRIWVSAPAANWKCKPAVMGKGVSLRPLEPALNGLRAWRDAIGASYDVRILSFQVGVHLTTVDGGQLITWAPVRSDREGVEPCLGVDGISWCDERDARDVWEIQVTPPHIQRRIREGLGQP